MDCNETTRILNSETVEQLQKARDEELAKVRKLRLVIKELKQMNCSKLAIPDKEQIEKALKVVKIGDYLYFNEKRDQCLLGLDEVCKVNLNYTERKVVRHSLSLDLQNNLQQIQSFSVKLQEELPEIFCDSNALNQEILDLEMQRRSNIKQLAQLRNQKCHYLKVAAELKMGPYLLHELDILYTMARQNQTKVNVLRRFFIQNFITRSDHGLKAIREVESYINDALEKELDASN